MIFDPIKKEVYTDKGEFVKLMDCPYKINWNKLEVNNSTLHKCAKCNHLILDTEFLSDDELLNIVKHKPETCIKIDLNQQNIKLISNGSREQK